MFRKSAKIIFFLTVLFFSTINTVFSQDEPEEELEYPVIPEFEQVNQEKSVLHIEDYSELERGFVPLDCQWDFFEDCNFISPEVFYPENKLAGLENMEGHLCRLPKYFSPDVNYGTFHCRITGLKPDTVYAMGIYRKIYSASRIWCNGKLAGSQGWVSKEEFDSRPQQRTKMVDLNSDENGEIDLLIHVSNYVTVKGGISKVLSITEKTHMIKVFCMNLLLDFLITGLLLSITLYYLIIYISNRRQYMYLFLSLICSGFIVSILSVGFSVFNLIFPNMPFNIEYKLYMLCIYFVMPVHIAYVTGLYAIKFSKVKWSIVAGFVVFFVAIAMPVAIYQRYIGIVTAVLYSLTVIPMYYMIRFTRKRTSTHGIKIFENAMLYGSNIVMIVLMALSNVYYQFIFNGLDFGYIKCFWYKIVVLVFAITQALVTAIRREVINRKVTRISEKMQHNNEALARYLPKSLLRLMNNSDMTTIVPGDNISLECMILSASMLNMQEISDNLTYIERIKILEHFYSRMFSIVRNQNGIISRMTEDGFIAIFPKCDDTVCYVAFEIQKKMKELKKLLRKSGLPDVVLGIGIHTGKVAAGIIGNETRYHASFISKEMDYAEKIMRQNKKVNSVVLISEEALQYCRSYSECLFDGRFVTIKGKSVLLYSLLPQKSGYSGEKVVELESV